MSSALANHVFRRAADQATRLRRLFHSDQKPVQTSPPPPATASRGTLISIASGKGGVGKTTIAVNLCIALAQRSIRTVLVDCDEGTANADLLCGVTPARRLHPSSLPSANSLADLAIEVPGGFRLVPGSSGPALEAGLSGTSQSRSPTAHSPSSAIAAIAQLTHEFDAVVVDTGAGVSASVLNAMLAADRPLVVMTPEPTALADAYALIKCLSVATTRRLQIGAIVNQVSGEREAVETHARIARTSARFLGLDVGLCAWLPREEAVRESIRTRHPLLLSEPKSQAARGIRRIASVCCPETPRPFQRAG